MNPIIPKEISWLSFNERVIQEADCSDVPLLERIKFLGIYSNNLDEYFRVRVATLKRICNLGTKATEILGYNPKATLKQINEIILKQQLRFEKVYEKIIRELAKQKIFLINEKELNVDQQKFIEAYFDRYVKRQLMPIMIEDKLKLPDLRDDRIYFAIRLEKEKTKKIRYALLEIPSKILPRFIELPNTGENRYLIFLDDIIRFKLKDIFFIFDFDAIEAHTIKLTKDAELDIIDNISESYIDTVSRSLKQRKSGNPVRFVFDREISPELLNFLSVKLHLTKDDTLIPGVRYHNFKDFINFPDFGLDKLKYERLLPIRHKSIETGKSILSVIKNKDILLFFPYHSFDHFLDLLREVSIDPHVRSIQITLYRVAKNSAIINSLLNAVRNGKKVTAVVELQARFDEEANIYWSNKLIEGGVKVIYGIKGLKIHSKLCLITREKKNKVQRFACVGTGNFNEDTARTYTDHLLLTSDIKVTNEVYKIFNFFNRNYSKDNFYHLIVSPFNQRNKIILLIKNEIFNVLAGKKAYIYIKINNLTDPEIIDLLYQAGEAGVDVKLIIRGMSSIFEDKKNTGVKATGIVDRYLEHTRFFIFCNNGNEKTFISSADFMIRNFDRRIEVSCPVFDKNIQKELLQIFKIQWQDNVKARILDREMKNRYVKSGQEEHKSQSEVYTYLKELHQTPKILI
jgi:polyphosphate kinase